MDWRRRERKSISGSPCGGGGRVALRTPVAGALQGLTLARPYSATRHVHRPEAHPLGLQLLTFESHTLPRSPPTSALHTRLPRSRSAGPGLPCLVHVYSLQVEQLTLCPDLHPRSSCGCFNSQYTHARTHTHTAAYLPDQLYPSIAPCVHPRHHLLVPGIHISAAPLTTPSLRRSSLVLHPAPWPP